VWLPLANDGQDRRLAFRPTDLGIAGQLAAVQRDQLGRCDASKSVPEVDGDLLEPTLPERACSQWSRPARDPSTAGLLRLYPDHAAPPAASSCR
jgi:hypothetical protein